MARYDGLSFWVLGVNNTRQQVDLLFRLAPDARCPAHRHVGPTDTLVIEGEQRIYEQRDGTWSLAEVRSPATFAGNEGDQMHSEEGGPEGAILLLSMKAIDGLIWETFDERMNVVDSATIEGFQRAFDRQRAAVE